MDGHCPVPIAYYYRAEVMKIGKEVGWISNHAFGRPRTYILCFLGL